MKIKRLLIFVTLVAISFSTTTRADSSMVIQQAREEVKQARAEAAIATSTLDAAQKESLRLSEIALIDGSPKSSRDALDALVQERRARLRFDIASAKAKSAVELLLQMQAFPETAEDLNQMLGKVVASPKTSEETDLFALAKAAQDTADKASAKSKNAIRIADNAAVEAFSIREKQGVSIEDKRDAASKALAATSAAIASFHTAKAAQDASNLVVGQLLTLQAEQGDPSNKSPATERVFQNALKDINQTTNDLQAASRRTSFLRTSARLAELGIKARSDQIANIDAERDEFKFLSVVDRLPDAASLLGAPSAKLTAGSKGGQVAFKFSLDRILGSYKRSTDVTLSSPTSKSSDSTTIVDSTNGFANSTAIQISQNYFGLLEKNAKDPKHFWVAGYAGKIGTETHKFFEEGTLARNQQRTIPKSVTLFGGIAPVSMDQLFLLTFQYQVAYEDADSEVQCPTASTFPVSCRSGPIGRPSQMRNRIFGFEARRSWDRFAIAPSFNYDTVSREKAFNLPIYFVPTADKDNPGLIGGLELSWAQKQHGSVGVFISAPFSILDN